MPALNLMNEGLITNLPRDVFVGVLAVVDASGVYGLSIGALPQQLAVFCRRDIEQMLLDPVVDSVDIAEKVLDGILLKQKQYLPQFV